MGEATLSVLASEALAEASSPHSAEDWLSGRSIPCREGDGASLGSSPLTSRLDLLSGVTSSAADVVASEHRISHSHTKIPSVEELLLSTVIVVTPVMGSSKMSTSASVHSSWGRFASAGIGSVIAGLRSGTNVGRRAAPTRNGQINETWTRIDRRRRGRR